MAKPDLEVFGKAESGSGSPSDKRGDCPFSQRIYLDLEEKGLPYKATFIEEGDNKPQWFMDHNPQGLMPLLRDGDQWIQDSEKIYQHLEKSYPEPSLKTPEQYKNVGENVFPTFTNWLKAKDASSPAKDEYIKEIQALNDHLQKNMRIRLPILRGPFIGGEKATDSDFALAPKLRHARVALKHYYNFEIPSKYSAVHNFIQQIEGRLSFKKTDVPDEMIIQGWKTKFELPDSMVPKSQN
eukprot:SM000079S22460  [mRNA]  locus=s79:289865:291848:+ [translate_table: standard]